MDFYNVYIEGAGKRPCVVANHPRLQHLNLTLRGAGTVHAGERIVSGQQWTDRANSDFGAQQQVSVPRQDGHARGTVAPGTQLLASWFCSPTRHRYELL